MPRGALAAAWPSCLLQARFAFAPSAAVSAVLATERAWGLCRIAGDRAARSHHEPAACHRGQSACHRRAEATDGVEHLVGVS